MLHRVEGLQVMLTAQGLELAAPSPGDIVTVLIRPPKECSRAMGSAFASSLGRDVPAHENPHHYRINAIWRVVATSSGSAVVEALTRYSSEIGKREIWPIALHRWFDASELYAAMHPDDQCLAEDRAEWDREPRW